MHLAVARGLELNLALVNHLVRLYTRRKSRRVRARGLQVIVGRVP